MIRALWFMVKVGLAVALVVWIAERPGHVKIEWFDYIFTIHVGLFLLLALATILLSIFIYRVIRTFVDFPKSYRRYAELKRTEKGRRALTLGLTAVAAGDTKMAVYQAHRTTKLLPNDKGLPLLLEAQAARLDGREEDANKSFVALLESKDAAFLGVRGLLQAALDLHQYTKALELAQQALTLHPKQKWILRIVYDLQIRQRDWTAARNTLYRAEKAGAITKEKAASDRIAMLLAEAEDDMRSGLRQAALIKSVKALKYNPAFVPSVSLASRLYNQTGKRNKAVKLIERAWKTNPHPELLSVWEALAPHGQTKKPLGRLQWVDKLLAINSDTAEGQLQAGRIAIHEGLWGEARAHLRRSEELAPTAQLYNALAELEEKSAHNEEAAFLWLEKSSSAPSGKTWVCAETGRIYDRWSAIAEPHGAFNTIRWDDPQGVHYAALSNAGAHTGDMLLEAPG